MRLIASISALFLLAACATAPQAVAPAPTGPAPASPRTAQMLALAGGASAPTQIEIERAFGPADITRQDGAGAALTYRYETCALLLLFSADGRNAMRLAEAHPSARRAGSAPPSLDQCAAEAAARRG